MYHRDRRDRPRQFPCQLPPAEPPSSFSLPIHNNRSWNEFSQPTSAIISCGSRVERPNMGREEVDTMGIGEGRIAGESMTGAARGDPAATACKRLRTSSISAGTSMGWGLDIRFGYQMSQRKNTYPRAGVAEELRANWIKSILCWIVLINTCVSSRRRLRSSLECDRLKKKTTAFRDEWIEFVVVSG